MSTRTQSDIYAVSIESRKGLSAAAAGATIYVDTIQGSCVKGIVNGMPVHLCRDGVHYVQLKSVIELLGGRVTYQAETRMCTFTVKNGAGGTYVSAPFAPPEAYRKSCERFTENGRVYSQLKALMRALGFEDVTSVWNHPDTKSTLILIKRCMKDAAVKMIREGGRLTVTAYVDFKGADQIPFRRAKGAETYGQLIEAGFKAWQGTYPEKGDGRGIYDDFGCYGHMAVSVNVVKKGKSPVGANQQFVVVRLDEGPFQLTSAEAKTHKNALYKNQIMALTSSLTWQYYTASMHLATAYHDGTPLSKAFFKQSVTHEFGHLLGIGDAYKTASRQVAVTAEIPDDDIMRNVASKVSGGERVAAVISRVSSNDIEMVLTGWLHNKCQFFSVSDGVRSVAIRR